MKDIEIKLNKTQEELSKIFIDGQEIKDMTNYELYVMYSHKRGTEMRITVFEEDDKGYAFDKNGNRFIKPVAERREVEIVQVEKVVWPPPILPW